MCRLNVFACLLAPAIMTGCYAAAWNRDSLDQWSGRALPENLAAQLPDLSGEEEIRVLVFGDSGKPSTFGTVAGWMAGTCAGGCDFALVLGDNFYLRGPTEMDPDKFDRHFNEPLRAAGESLAGIPFWVVLGNHGYMTLPLRPRADPLVQLEYTYAQDPGDPPLWLMPAHYFLIPLLPDWLTMVGFDSHFATEADSFMGDVDEYERARERYFGQVLEIIDREDLVGWRVLFGHHPHLTVGAHVERNKVPAEVKRFDNARSLVYFSGHDHDQQLIESGPLIQVVQGAASKTRDSRWGGRKARQYFDDVLVPGLAERGRTVSADYCEKLGFGIVTFREFEMEMTFFWGEEDSVEPAGNATWSWRLDDNGEFSRMGAAPAGGFVDICPD